MRKVIFFLIIISLIGIVIYRVMKPQKVELESKTEGIPVKLHYVKTGNILETTSLSGTIISNNEVKVVTKVGGRVLSLCCDEGDYVEKGQLLIKIEDDEIRAQLNQAQAALLMAKTRLRLAQTGARPQEKKQVDNTVEMAKASFEVTESNYNRMKTLYENKAISKQQFEAVETQYKVTKAQYDSALQGQSIVSEGARKEDKEAAEAGVEQAAAAVSYAKIMLNNTKVYSPINGFVSMKLVTKGEMAAPGYPLLILVDNNALYFEAQVSEKDLEKINIEQSVNFTIDAISDKTFSGKVSDINPAVENFSRSAKIKVKIDSKDATLKSGMFARGNIITKNKENVVVIPKDCIKKTDNKNIVFVVENNIAQKKEIEIGIINDINVEVIDGLKIGDKVVVSGQGILKDGDMVKIVKLADG